jgi:flagellar hook protein FlgE
MLGSIFTGLSGLITYSNGLDVVSNNVANLNTPGFKGNDLLYRDLYYRFQWVATQGDQLANEQRGAGVGDQGTLTRFAQGDLQDTGNDTDVAVDGNGFFIIRVLVTSDTGDRVAGLGDNGGLTDITLDGLRTIAPAPTSEVSFVDNLSTDDEQHVIDDLALIDTVGVAQPVTVTFTNNGQTEPRSWLIDVENEDGDNIVAGAEIRFQANGSPAEDFNTIEFTYTPEEGEPFDVTFFFGNPGSFTNATSFSGGPNSTLIVEDQDGSPSGSLISVGFNRDGALNLEYSNGESVQSTRLALAWFDDLQNLRQIEGARFLAQEGQNARIGGGTEGVFGDVVEQTIEISNIELTQEFTDLIVVQRGYQASSQVITVSNEMLEQLFQIGSAR